MTKAIGLTGWGVILPTAKTGVMWGTKMTHDELLERIDELKLDVGDSGMNEEHKASYALRAVVELHSSFTPEFGGGIDYCWADDRPYPCPTIQAIEKELG